MIAAPTKPFSNGPYNILDIIQGETPKKIIGEGNFHIGGVAGGRRPHGSRRAPD